MGKKGIEALGVPPKVEGERVVQFSIFIPQKVGYFNGILNVLRSGNVCILAVCTVDHSDTSVVRMVVDDGETAKCLWKKRKISFDEREVVAVECGPTGSVGEVVHALAQAEMDVNYVYPFLVCPRGYPRLVLGVEDRKLAEDVLIRRGISVLRRPDIVR